VSGPNSGTITGTGANLTYAPLGAYGTITFTYVVNDGLVDSAPATVSISVAAPSGKPSAPSSLIASALSSSQIRLIWTDNSINEDGFKIERSMDNKTWTQIDSVPMNTTGYTATGLLSNKNYYFRVRAWNVLGYSSYSNVRSAKTQR
jgi:hypothetical protein